MAKDDVREERIEMEIIVDTYDSHECAMGWYCYLEDKLEFPFSAQIVNAKKPSRNKELVKVISMADSDDCMGGMWVTVEDGDNEYDVPLEQIYPVKSENIDELTIQSVEDWHYWVEQGYTF